MFSLRVLTFSRVLPDIQSRHSPASWSAWHLGVLGSQDIGVVRKSTYCSHRCTTASARTDPLINQTSAVTDMTTAWMQSRLATDEGLKRAFFPALCLRASAVCVKGYERNIGCMREIINPRFWESKYREVCACKTWWEMLTLYSCVGEELLLFFILCTVQSFTSFKQIISFVMTALSVANKFNVSSKFRLD